LLDLKMLGRFDHRPFQAQIKPIFSLNSKVPSWFDHDQSKVKPSPNRTYFWVQFFAYRLVQLYQTKRNQTHFGFGLAFFMFSLTLVKPNLIKLTLSSILLNNPLSFFLSFSNVHFIHVDIMNYTDTFSLYNMATMHKVITRYCT